MWFREGLMEPSYPELGVGTAQLCFAASAFLDGFIILMGVNSHHWNLKSQGPYPVLPRSRKAWSLLNTWGEYVWTHPNKYH